MTMLSGRFRLSIGACIRLIKKGVEAGGKQFKQCLGILTIPADRIKVYEEWTDACLAAQSFAANNGDSDRAATFAEEYKRTLLAARKEFPAVGCAKPDIVRSSVCMSSVSLYAYY